jgi:hypothetical protein
MSVKLAAQRGRDGEACGKKLVKLRADRVAQVVKCLPSNHRALSSNPNTAKKIKKLARLHFTKQGRCVSVHLSSLLHQRHK